LTFILLLVSLILPNSDNHLSSIIVRPVGKAFFPSTLLPGKSSSSSTPGIPVATATGVWGMNETDVDVVENGKSRNRNSEQKIKTPLGVVTWFGIMGPEIWIGTMREPLSQFPLVWKELIIQESVLDQIEIRK
jgi:hypothetical protein